MTLSKITHILVASVLGSLVLIGCQSSEPVPGPHQALDYPGELENTDTLVLLDRALQGMLSVEGQRASYTPEGRLFVQANLRNLLERPTQIQAQTVFRDDKGMSSGDESAWVTTILQPNSTETYSETALNNESTQYTIRVRLPR